MRNPNIIAAYQHAEVQGATPLGQVVALYDTILRDFRRAADAIERGNVEARVFELNHALTVIGHLEGVLNFERGASAAETLQQFYRLTRGMVLEANTRASREAIEPLIETFTSMRNAWSQAEKNLTPAGEAATLHSATGAAATSAPSLSPVDNTPIPSQSKSSWWNA